MRRLTYDCVMGLVSPSSSRVRVTLFGSRARGDVRPDSDHDVTVFLHELKDFGEEARRLAEIETDILYDTGAVINALPFGAGALREQTDLMGELEREGQNF